MILHLTPSRMTLERHLHDTQCQCQVVGMCDVRDTRISISISISCRILKPQPQPQDLKRPSKRPRDEQETKRAIGATNRCRTRSGGSGSVRWRSVRTSSMKARCSTSLAAGAARTGLTRDQGPYVCGHVRDTQDTAVASPRGASARRLVF